jgi:hypothetical protein
MASATRQHYNLATGGALQATDSAACTTPKYAKGGRVPAAYFTGTNAGGKRVTSTDKINAPGTKFSARNARTGPQAVQTKGAKNMGNVPTTTMTQKGSQVPAGFKRHIANKF